MTSSAPAPPAAEWSAEAAPSVPLPTIVSSTDLFDGELFGDELIDIYNSTVEGHHHDAVGKQSIYLSSLETGFGHLCPTLQNFSCLMSLLLSLSFCS